MTDWKEGLFPYQIEGVEHFLQADKSNNKNAANFDDPGLGKSAQSIRAADALNLRRILVSCPAVARINWGREFAKFQIIPRKVFVITKSKDLIPEDAEVVVIGQDMLINTDMKRQLLSLSFEALIVDEAHAFKNRISLRTKALYGDRLNGQGGIISCADRVWILTGTPMPNNCSELFSHLRALFPERLERNGDGRFTYTQFIKHFCQVDFLHFGARTVEKIRGNRNIPELKQRLSGIYVRRKKEQVLKDLPPRQWGTVVLEPPKRQINDIKKFEKGKDFDHIQAILDAANASHHSGDDTLADEILAQANLSAMATLRRMVGLAKVQPTVEFIQNEFEGGTEKIILFAYHKEVIEQINAALKVYSPVVLTGETSKSNRQKAIDNFQNDENTRLFIGQITAANSAITLTASDNVLIMEPSWTPAENVQAAARAHRIGQKSSSVMARYITLAGSLDEDLTRVILRKTKQISEIMF
jgi:SNF2 family DNA or RNA helicase